MFRSVVKVLEKMCEKSNGIYFNDYKEFAEINCDVDEMAQTDKETFWMIIDLLDKVSENVESCYSDKSFFSKQWNIDKSGRWIGVYTDK